MLFLFLLLQGIAWVILLNNNYIQRIAFADISNIVSGNIFMQINKWTDYLSLREQNQQLQDENIYLRNMLKEAFYITDSSRVFYTDSSAQRRYAYVPAKVINKSVNRQFNFLTIDKGKNVGIEEGMAVTGAEGIVGVVFGVSERFATVMPVINRNFKVSVMLKKNNHLGSLVWEGRSDRYATLNEISLHVPVSIGDTIVVSGYSGRFPEKIPVGTVHKIEQKDGSFYTIEVLLAIDFRTLYFVTVVEDYMIIEQELLEQEIIDMQ